MEYSIVHEQKVTYVDYKPVAGTTMVPESDKRPAVLPAVEQFEDIE